MSGERSETPLVDGIRAVRAGSLLGLVAWALVLADHLFLTFSLLPSFYTSPAVPPWLERIVDPLTRLMGATALVLIIISLFNFYGGASHLRRFDPRLDVGRMGALLAVGGILVSFLGSSIVIMAMQAAGAGGQEGVPPALALSMNGVVIVGSGLLIVGSLLLAVMMVRLTGEGLGWGYGIGGVLYLAMETLRTLATLGFLKGILPIDVATILEDALGFTSMLLIYWSSRGFLRGYHSEGRVPTGVIEPTVREKWGLDISTACTPSSSHPSPL